MVDCVCMYDTRLLLLSSSSLWSSNIVRPNGNYLLFKHKQAYTTQHVYEIGMNCMMMKMKKKTKIENAFIRHKFKILYHILLDSVCVYVDWENIFEKITWKFNTQILNTSTLHIKDAKDEWMLIIIINVDDNDKIVDRVSNLWFFGKLFFFVFFFEA